MFYTKYFAKELAVIFYNFFFHNKIYKYFLQKKIKTKLTRNMSFFSRGNEFYNLECIYLLKSKF